MRVVDTFYRAHDPRWAWTPLSGKSASIHGGRWNSKGVPALYLGATVDCVINEMSHGLSRRLEPLLMCSYDVDCEPIADLTDADVRERFDASLSVMKTAWFEIALEGGEPPTWEIASRVRQAGYPGILVSSFAQGAKDDHKNLVLWDWGAELPLSVRVYDPFGKLPKNQVSWE